MRERRRTPADREVAPACEGGEALEGAACAGAWLRGRQGPAPANARDRREAEGRKRDPEARGEVTLPAAAHGTGGGWQPMGSSLGQPRSRRPGRTARASGARPPTELPIGGAAQGCPPGSAGTGGPGSSSERGSTARQMSRRICCCSSSGRGQESGFAPEAQFYDRAHSGKLRFYPEHFLDLRAHGNVSFQSCSGMASHRKGYCFETVSGQGHQWSPLHGVVR